MNANQRNTSWRKRALITAALTAGVLAATVWAVQPTGDDHHLGSASGPLITADATNENGSWQWLAVRTRSELNLDNSGIVGDVVDRAASATGLSRSAASEEEHADREATLADAWHLAQRYAHCTDTCAGEQPTIELPDSLVGGSIGLVSTLAYIDHLVEGDLTGGLHIAATGAVTTQLTDKIDAPVLPVGGVRFKLDEARDHGAQLTLIPGDNVADEGVNLAERNTVDDSNPIIAVNTIDDALVVLCQHNSKPACELIAAN